MNIEKKNVTRILNLSESSSNEEIRVKYRKVVERHEFRIFQSQQRIQKLAKCFKRFKGEVEKNERDQQVQVIVKDEIKSEEEDQDSSPSAKKPKLKIEIESSDQVSTEDELSEGPIKTLVSVGTQTEKTKDEEQSDESESEEQSTSDEYDDDEYDDEYEDYYYSWRRNRGATQRQYNDYKNVVQKQGASELVFNPSTDDIRTWRGRKPSKCRVQDGISEVLIYSPTHTGELSLDDDDDKEMFIDNFNQRRTVDVTISFILRLAEEYDILTGKWMIMNLSWKEIDSVWAKLSSEMMKGNLHGNVLGMGIYARDDSMNNPINYTNTKPMLFIFTKDFRQSSTNMFIADEIKKICPKLKGCEMRYKATAYSVLKISGRNKYKLKISLYDA